MQDADYAARIDAVKQRAHGRWSEVLAAAGGSVSDLLENIPSIEVTTDGEISLRGNSSVEVWINGKASGLTSDNRA
ncbi:MAG: hypothetical protein IIZ92_16520, partial [Aquincola sp.]|nr:hypothetical protein [Aquincola sp.]